MDFGGRKNTEKRDNSKMRGKTEKQERDRKEEIDTTKFAGGATVSK